MMKYYKKISCLLTIFCLAAAPIYGQYIVEGRILDAENRRGISAVSIHLEERQYYTDPNGNFRIATEKRPEVLVLLHVSYDTVRVTLDKLTNLTLEMSPKHNQIEVVEVNTGYQSIAKERATGSFEKIDNAALNILSSPNILDRLEGMSTLNFDKHPNRPEITLRGFSTINGPKAPLIILDNFPYEGDLANLDPANIESVTLLKDGAASSIWGTRAGNGVIVITTKSGELNAPSRMAFESNMQIQLRPDLFRLDLISSPDLIALERFLFDEGRYVNDESSPARPYLSPVVMELIKNRDGELSNKELELSLARLGEIDNRYDYRDRIYQTGINQRYALSHSMGTDALTLYNSLAYNKGIDNLSAKNSRLSFQNDTHFKLFDKVDVNAKLTYTRADARSGREGHGSSNNLRSYIGLVDDSGQSAAIPYYNASWLASMKDTGLQDWYKYPLDEYKYSFVESSTDFLATNIRVGYKALESLRFDVMYNTGFDAVNENRNNLIESYFTRDLINRYTEFENGIVRYNIPYGGIIDRNNGRLSYSNYRGQATFDLQGPVHSFSGVIGVELRTLKTEEVQHRQYGVDPEVITVGKVDYNRLFPDFVNGRTQYIPFFDDNMERRNINVSQFFNGSYAYKGRYTLSASARRDASNVFGVNTNDRWTPLWSLGGMWSLTDEPWLNIPVADDLKLRFTYGQSGLVNNSRSVVTVLSYRTSAVSNFVTAVPTQFPNPELRWEKSNMLNVGLDFSLWNGRVKGDVAYYQKIGKDLLGPSPVDISTGVGTSLIRNVASMKGTGMDMNINVQMLDRSVSWRTHLIFSYNRNSVTDYYATNSASYQMLSQGSSINPLIGKSLYGFLSYDFRGLDDEGNPVSTWNGEPSTDYASIRTAHYDNLVYSGSATPIFFGSFGNTVSYGSVTLNLNLQYKFGHYFASDVLVYNSLINMDVQNGSGLYEKRWKQPGDENLTNVPAFVYPIDNNREQIYTASIAGVEPADHIRIQFLRIGYDFNPKNSGFLKTPIKLFLTAENLGVVWKKTKRSLDPDYGIALVDNKRFSFGFSMNF